MNTAWTNVTGEDLQQGDIIIDCPVPRLLPTVGQAPSDPVDITVAEYDVSIITQSCKLVRSKSEFVAVCPVFELEYFVDMNRISKAVRGMLLDGRYRSYYPMKHYSQDAEFIVIDFGEIFSIPFDYLTLLAANQLDRPRLISPFIEHLSHAFGNYYSTPALPE